MSPLYLPLGALANPEPVEGERARANCVIRRDYLDVFSPRAAR